MHLFSAWACAGSLSLLTLADCSADCFRAYFLPPRFYTRWADLLLHDCRLVEDALDDKSTLGCLQALPTERRQDWHGGVDLSGCMSLVMNHLVEGESTG